MPCLQRHREGKEEEMPKVIQVIENKEVFDLGKSNKINKQGLMEGMFIITKYYDFQGKDVGIKHDDEYYRWQEWVRNQGTGKVRGK